MRLHDEVHLPALQQFAELLCLARFVGGEISRVGDSPCLRGEASGGGPRGGRGGESSEGNTSFHSAFLYLQDEGDFIRLVKNKSRRRSEGKNIVWIMTL